MADTAISNDAARDACDAVVDRLDAGASAGKLKIYDGTKPSGGPDEAVSTQTLLAELTLGDPAFGAAADGDPGGVATANSITGDTSADATGTATWFRAEDSDGNPVIDGDVGESGSGADLILNTTSIESGAAVDVDSWTVTMPES